MEALRPLASDAPSLLRMTDGPMLGSALHMGARPPSKHSRPLPRLEPDRGTPAVLVVVAMIGLGMAAVGCRDAIGRALPASRSVYATIGVPVASSGLTLADVRTSTAAEASGAILTLEGQIRNGKGGATAVPNLRIVVRDARQENIYTWTAAPPKASLAPGETVTFQSRLVAPPDSGRDLVVGFAEPAGAAELVAVKESR